jgi:hypothetical protein
MARAKRSIEPEVKTQRKKDIRPEGKERLVRHSRTADRFYVDPARIPDGMSYEWKRQTYVGKEDRTYQTMLAGNHWTPVPASRHPEITDEGGDKQIIVDGLTLMERPKYLTDEAHAEDKQQARRQVGDQMERLQQDIGQAPGVPKTPTTVARTYERTEVPADE